MNQWYLFLTFVLIILGFPVSSWKFQSIFERGSFFSRSRRMSYISDDNDPSATIKQLKETIVSIVDGTNNGVNASPLEQAQILELVNDLSKYNKVVLSGDNIDSNQPMQGRWKLLYTTNREFSSGKVGPWVGYVEQDIDLRRKLYTNYLHLFRPKGGILDGRLQGTFVNIPNENAWKVIFQTIQLRIFGCPVFQKALPEFYGQWDLMFLDETFRVFYAKNLNQPQAQQNNTTSIKRNLYVMQRVF